MLIPSFKEIEAITDSRYALVMLVSKRARQLVEGSDPLIAVNEGVENPVTVAMMEVLDQDVIFGEPMSDAEYREKERQLKLAKELEEAMDMEGALEAETDIEEDV